MENDKIAVLIDGDNADASLVEHILNEVSKHGRITIKRIYADFTMQSMNNWKNQLNAHAIRPMQKFQYTKGKNSTDSALIIDAMDILHAQLVTTFCIVSSDSDYTGIAHRIREQGLRIIGIGQSHTPEAFVKACDMFTYTELLAPQKEKNHVATNETNTPTSQSKKSEKLTNILTKQPIEMDVIDKAFQMVYDELTDSALASQLGPALKKVDPTFDIRKYGHSSFRKFLEALKPKYEVVLHHDKMTISLKRGKESV